MPYTNPYFSSTTGYSGEVQLIDDLVREQIKMFGIDLLYMPRRILNLDYLLNEGSKAAFEFAMPIPMYVTTTDGYDNGSELLTRFGIQSADQIKFQLSRSEFLTYYAPFINSYYESHGDGIVDPLSGETAARPKEGDLIYFPLDDSVFEVKYVQFDVPFFQLGKGYIFEMQCERFVYSGETISTGYDGVDDTETESSYDKMVLILDGAGEGTFQNNEVVTLYDFDNLPDPEAGEVPEPPASVTDPFSFYNRAGYLSNVNTVTARVVSWNYETKTLVIDDLSNNDPLLENDDLDVVVSKLDRVLAYGSTSQASYISTSASHAIQAFDDSFYIQNDFDDIKIEDAADQNPFGFN